MTAQSQPSPAGRPATPAPSAASAIHIGELSVWGKRSYWPLKRLFDAFVSAVVLLVLSPLFLLISLLVFLDDPHDGPFYAQLRNGRGGKPFRMYKFRSMRKNAEAMLDQLLDQNEMDGPVFKIKDDPRITRMGKILRKTSLDELPQFFNVFLGDMSIVGPRPPLPREVAQYDEYQYQRLYVTPGLTCYWQIAPNRNDISFDQWVDMDIRYVETRSPWVDIKLIFGTVPAMLGKSGR